MKNVLSFVIILFSVLPSFSQDIDSDTLIYILAFGGF
jgi:hypothetical protein